MNAVSFRSRPRRRSRQSGPTHTREARERVSLAEMGGGASCILQTTPANPFLSRDFGASCGTAQRHTELSN